MKSFIKYFPHNCIVDMNKIIHHYRLVVTNKNITTETKNELIAAYWNCNVVLDQHHAGIFITVYNRCVDEINSAMKDSQYDENKEQERLERRKQHILDTIRSSNNHKSKRYIEYDLELNRRLIEVCAGHLVHSYLKNDKIYDYEYSNEFDKVYERCWNAFDRQHPKETGEAIIAITAFLAMYNAYVDEWNDCLAIVKEEIAKEKRRLKEEKEKQRKENLYDFTTIEITREKIKNIQKKNKLKEEQLPFENIINKFNPSISNVTNSNKYTNLKDYSRAMPVTLDRIKSFKDIDALYKLIAEDKYIRSCDVAELNAIKNRCKMSLNEDNFIGFVLVYNECVEKITNRKIKHQEEGNGYKFANHHNKKPSTRELKTIINDYASKRDGGVLDEYKVNLSVFNYGVEKYRSGILC